MPHISALLPSRYRPDSLRRSILSLRELAADPAGVEVLVAYDPDDPVTGHVARELGCEVWEAPERYGYRRLYDYYNQLAGHAVGDWLLLWNDDAFMTSADWDTAIAALAADVLVADLTNHFSPGLCCFPAVRRAAVEALGVYSLATPHVDSVWQDIGRRLGAIRPVDAFVRHERADLTGGHQDATWHEGRTGLDHAGYFSPGFQAQIDAAAERVRVACLVH